MTNTPSPDEDRELIESLTRPIIGIENRAAQEVFDIMCDRIRNNRRLSDRAKLEGALCPFAIMPDEEGYDISHIGPEQFNVARAVLNRSRG